MKFSSNSRKDNEEGFVINLKAKALLAFEISVSWLFLMTIFKLLTEGNCRFFFDLFFFIQLFFQKIF